MPHPNCPEHIVTVEEGQTIEYNGQYWLPEHARDDA
jgi:hypothetical protein